MRKLVIFASLALAFVSVACEKENNKEQPAPIDPNTVVFTASLPTKTTIDANDQVVSWASGDEVKFVWAGGSTTVIRVRLTEGHFHPVPGVPDPYLDPGGIQIS